MSKIDGISFLTYSKILRSVESRSNLYRELKPSIKKFPTGKLSTVFVLEIIRSCDQGCALYTEVIVRMCSVKKLFFSQNSQENARARVSFLIILQVLQNSQENTCPRVAAFSKVAFWGLQSY